MFRVEHRSANGGHRNYLGRKHDYSPRIHASRSVQSTGSDRIHSQELFVNTGEWCVIVHPLLCLDTAAREALTDMPPRNENELDTITLHNLAIMNMEEDASGGFEKLTFLTGNGNFPREAFVNLCLLYLKYEVRIRRMMWSIEDVFESLSLRSTTI